MRIRQASLAILGVCSLTSLTGTTPSVQAQTSSPTKITPRMLRGTDWSRFRTAMPTIIVGHFPGRGRGSGPSSWNAAASLAGFGQVTFFEALEKQETLFVSNVEGTSTQRVSSEIQKNLDYNLTPDEVTAVKNKLATAHERMVAYDVPTIGSDEAEIRKLFEFARSLNVLTIVSDPAPDALPAIDKVANEFNINVAIRNGSKKETPAYADPRDLLKAVANLSKRVGVCVDTANWMEEGIKPVEGLKILRDKVIAVHLLDRTTLGKGGHNVTLGRARPT